MGKFYTWTPEIYWNDLPLRKRHKYFIEVAEEYRRFSYAMLPDDQKELVDKHVKILTGD